MTGLRIEFAFETVEVKRRGEILQMVVLEHGLCIQ